MFNAATSPLAIILRF